MQQSKVKNMRNVKKMLKNQDDNVLHLKLLPEP